MKKFYQFLTRQLEDFKYHFFVSERSDFFLTHDFKDPYKDMDNFRDQEMERLIKAIEEMKTHARYH